jgi:hypothetical protein
VALSPVGKSGAGGSVRRNSTGCPGWRGWGGTFSAHQRTLETQLKGLRGSGGGAQHDLEMLGGLEKRVGLVAVGRPVLAAKPGAQIGQSPAQALEQMIDGVQRERRHERVEGRPGRVPGQQSIQQATEPAPRHGVARQHVGQVDRKAPPATTTPTPIRAPDPLASLGWAALAAVGVVAAKLAVAVESFDGSAERTSQLLEAKQVAAQFFEAANKTPKRFSHPPCWGKSAAASRHFGRRFWRRDSLEWI